MSAFLPDVPFAPGVPPVLRDIQTAPDDELTGDTPDEAQDPEPVWAIYDANGNGMTTFDSFVSIEFRNEKRLSNYPIEGSEFETYNKVSTPYEVVVTLNRGGSDTDREQFLAEIVDAVSSVESYSVVTPEDTFEPVNPVRYDYRRTSENGVTLLTVEIVFQQIRAEAKITFTKTKEAASAGQVDDGPVQTKPAPADTGAPK